MDFPHGFGIPLVDFAAFVAFALLASLLFRPTVFYRWVFFVLSAALAVLFVLAWAIDLGAHV